MTVNPITPDRSRSRLETIRGQSVNRESRAIIKKNYCNVGVKELGQCLTGSILGAR
ncbi:uncharacterized protein BO88DRAFT_409179 [Aspergillus vadensis CBS 113365]|uniref:Uncharacterized protein n=1 Tax=Aspergillus vadensis (strain CBS 113365 / IMI 142717 / IBT 24658) TaxID=1448311 RepID=A0A319AVV5_ASPVC|nr:hypothetical protein BO88DRAFT_409179 [Aspergillus vadensis CBS 113365]PYH63501.1 hypothetical protein BO88DRAFT_409179 [Aspergillus vadensis CBS 113365]